MRKVFFRLSLIISFIFLICLIPFKVLATDQKILLTDLENGVSIIGTFNGLDETSNPMQKERDNVWSVELNSVYSDTTDNNFAIVTKSKSYKWNGNIITTFGTYSLTLNSSDDLVFDSTLTSKKIKVIFNMSNYDYTTDTGATITILDYELTEVSDATTLLDAITNKKANIKMMNDIKITSGLSIDYIAYLDLNGYALQYDNASTKSSVISVITTGDLTINDTRTTSTHQFDSTNPTWVLTSDSATGTNIQTVTGGVITGGRVKNGGGIYNEGVVTFNEGNIVGCEAYDNDFNLATNGGAVYNKGVFTIVNGNIKGCYVNGVWSSCGGAIYNEGTVNMLGGTISNCKINSQDSPSSYKLAVFGAAIYNTNNGIFNMSGGEISNCFDLNDYKFLTGDTYPKYLKKVGIKNDGKFYISETVLIKDSDGFYNTGTLFANCDAININVENKGEIKSKSNNDTTITKFNNEVYNYGSIYTGQYEGKVENKNTGKIYGGTFNQEVINSKDPNSENIPSIDGGTFNSVVKNGTEGSADTRGNISGGTFNDKVFNYGGIDLSWNLYPSRIINGTFNGEVENFAIIEGGTFKNTTNNSSSSYSGAGNIKNGYFYGKVNNKTSINSGNFYGEVINDGNIFGGYFYDNVNVPSAWNAPKGVFYGNITGYIPSLYSIEYNINGEAYEIVRATKDTLLLSPIDESYVEWYTSNTFSNDTKWDFVNDKVTSDLTLYAKFTGTTVETTNGLIEAIKNSGYIKLNNDIVLSEAQLTIETGKQIILDLNGHIIEQTGAFNVITNLGELIIIDSNHLMEHRFDTTNTVWTLAPLSTLEENVAIVKGGVITGGKSGSAGGIINNGTLIMMGGSIVGCSDSGTRWFDYVGGIYNLKTLKIKGNTTIQGCDGNISQAIYNFNDSSMFLDGGYVYGTVINGSGSIITRSPNFLSTTIFYDSVKYSESATTRPKVSAGIYYDYDLLTIGDIEGTYYIIKFIDTTIYKNILVVGGGYLPEISIEEDGYIFDGWYNEEDNKKIDYTQLVTSNQNYHAKWKIDETKLNKLIDDLNTAKSELQTAIDTKADATELTAKFNDLQNQINTLDSIKNNYVSADETLKTNLLNEISSAQATLNSAISDLTDDLNTAKSELQTAIDTKASATEVTSKFNDLQNQINTLDSIKNNYVSANETLKTTLLNEISSAQATLQTAIDKVAGDLQEAITSLNKSIVEGDAELNNNITALTNTLNIAKEALKKADADNKSELEGKIATAQTTLQTAIDKLTTDLNTTKSELQTAISKKADATDLVTKFNNLQSQITTLDNIKNNYVAGDEELKKTLESEITKAKNTLQSAIAELTTDLNTTKSELQEAINSGDTDLSSKIIKLNEALSTMEATLKAVDVSNKEELTNNLNEVKELLEEGINTLSNRLYNTENKIEQLNGKITTIIIIFSSVIVLINGGMIAFALVWKRRRGL